MLCLLVLDVCCFVLFVFLYLFALYDGLWVLMCLGCGVMLCVLMLIASPMLNSI